MKPQITQERLKEVMYFDVESLLFTWIKPTSNKSRIKIGGVVGHINKISGYTEIRVDGRTYYAHRLIWLYLYGYWPKVVDHINGNKLDNRLVNLRDGTSRGNQSNMKCHREGHLVGTSFCKRQQTWRASIYIDGKDQFYLTQQEASDAYQRALKELDETVDNVS